MRSYRRGMNRSVSLCARARVWSWLVLVLTPETRAFTVMFFRSDRRRNRCDRHERTGGWLVPRGVRWDRLVRVDIRLGLGIGDRRCERSGQERGRMGGGRFVSFSVEIGLGF
jgi:hypothetical protein